MAKKKKTYAEFMKEKYGATNDYVDNVQAPLREKQDEDIAPVKSTTENRTWFSSGKFEDGYQFGDISKTIVGSTQDLMGNIYSGAAGILESTIDAGAYIAGGVGGLFGADEFKAKTQEFIQKDLIDEEKIGESLAKFNGGLVSKLILGEDTAEESSIWGEKADSLAQSGGQLAGTIGLQAVGVPWFVTTGVTSFGGGVDEALNDDATFGQAGLSAAITAGADILTEKLFGGSGLGEKGLINLDGLTKGISSKVVKALTDYGVDVAAEGFEEVGAEIISKFGDSLYKEENFLELAFNEEALDEYIESFVGGAVLGGGMNVGKAVNSVKSGRDYRTGLTENEQKVFDKVYEGLIADAEKAGKELSSKEKSELYDDIMEKMETGEISIDTIEEVLGGESYNAYKSALDSENNTIKELEGLYEGNELKQAVQDILDNSEASKLKSKLSEEVFGIVKDSKLAESYYEKGRAKEKFTADLSEYDTKQQETVKRAIESGILNNTRRAHQLVDLVAKLEADKGVLFDFSNTEKINGTSFAVDGRTVNAYVTEDGKVTLNVESPKYLQSVVGHELTHIFEGTELYDTLQKTLFEYAEAKGEYKDRLRAAMSLYKGVKGYEGENGFKKIKNEVAADLVGDYLFTDNDFIRKLHTENRNVFQKIYDEIKYLCKVVTAGSKEARQLEKVKHAFEEVYRSEVKSNAETKGEGKYSLGYHAGDLGKSEVYSQQGFYRDTGHFGTGTYFVGDLAKIENYNKRDGKPAPKHSVEFDNYNLYRVKGDKDGYDLHDQLRVIDGGITEEWLNAALKEEFKLFSSLDAYDIAKEKFGEDWYKEEAMQYALEEVAKRNNIEIMSKDEYAKHIDADETYEWLDVDYVEYLKETIKEAENNANKKYSKFRDAVFSFKLRFGFRGNVEKALRDVLEYQKENESNREGGKDSLATVFMKSLGYEGVDTRGTALDNTTYGSVIYDLKGDDLARKKAIGTAKYSLSEDSTGRQLSKGQQEYFRDSKVRDENGNLKVMYHGTPNGKFTVFKDGTYFTENKWYADLYQNPGASSISTGKVASDPKTYEVYLDIKKPFDINDAEAKAIYINDYIKGGNAVGINPYLSDAEYDKISSIDWTEGEDLREFLIDNGYDYDGLVLDEGAVGGYGEEVKQRGKSYVIFSPEQVKNTDNLNPTSDPDIRFSLSKSVEETKDLMAVHNLHTDEVLKQLEMGGLVYPSVAITNPEKIAHDDFGEVTAILKKDAIDPKKSKYNKIYSTDAYTPTFPSISYEVNSEAANRISQKVLALYDSIPKEYQRALGYLRDEVNINDRLNSFGGEKGLIDEYANSYDIKQLYLAEKGEVVPTEIKRTETQLSDVQKEMYQAVVDKMGAEAFNSFSPNDGYTSPMTARKQWMEKNADNLKEAFAEYWASDGTMTKEEALEIANSESNPYWMREARAVRDYIRTGGVTVKEETDINATNAKIDEKISDSDYKQWLQNLFAGIEGQSGIRNSKDTFTPSGNRRSFAQLHDPVTIDNVINAMRKKGQTGEGAFGIGNIFGASAQEYKSTGEAKAHSNELGTIEQAEYDAIKERIESRLFDIAGKYANGNDIIDAKNTLVEAVAKYETKAEIARYLKQFDYVYKYTDSIVDDIIGVRNYIRSLPRPYFEAKPQRAVGFDEVAVFVIPRNADVKLKQELLNRGYSIAEYDPDVEGDRQKVVNSFEEYKFSLSDASGTPYKYGDSTFTGNNVAYTAQEDIAPTQETIEEAKATEDVAPLPRYETPVSDPSVNELEMRKEELEGKITAATKANDLDTYNQLVSEYQAVVEKIEQDNAFQSERLASLNDADAPIEQEENNSDYGYDPVTIDSDSLRQMTDSIGDSFGLNDEGKKELSDVIQSFAQKEFATKEELESELWHRFGTQYIEQRSDEIAQAKQYLRSIRIKVTPEVRTQFSSAKEYVNFMRSNWGKLYFSQDSGEGVDQIYQHLSDPEEGLGLSSLFDADITSYGDMLQRIADIANSPVTELVPKSLTNEELHDATDMIWGGIQEYREAERMLAVEESMDELNSQLYNFAPLPESDQKTAPAKEAYEAIKPKPKKEPRLARATPEEQARAEILTEEPKVNNKKRSGWSMFREKFLDKGSVFEDLSLKTKNRELMGKWNYILYAESRAQRLMQNGADDAKSLDSIRKEVESTGKAQQFYEYLYHKHNVDRMNLEERYEDVKNKPVFGYSVTSEESQRIVNRYESENPDFKAFADDVYAYMNHLRKQMVDSGVISQETADLWAEMYPHYVPIRRLGDTGLNINVPLDTGKTGVNAPIKRAKGGNRDILPLFDTIAQRTIQTYKAIAKNNFGVELKNTLGSTIESDAASVDDLIDSIDTQDELLQEGKNGKNPTFTVFENGEKVTFEITDEMYDALKPKSDTLSYRNKVLNTLSKFHKGLLTEYNPVFAIKNAVKDAQDILINSQHAAETYRNLPKAYNEMRTKGRWYQEYLDNGGEYNTYFDSSTNTFTEEKTGIRKLVGIPLDIISTANNYIEMAPRLAEYIASREAGASVEVAMLDAARVTTNFAAGGDVAKFLDGNGATFLNASIQGAMQQVRNVREAKANGLKGWVGLATKFAIAGLPAMILNELLWDDDEEYEELADYVKDNYYIVAKYGDGQFVRIPKGRTLAVIQDAMEQVKNAATGDDEVDLKSFLELAVSNLAPNNPIDNNVLAPIMQVAKNKTWYGEDLVPTRLQDLPEAEQFDESTDALSKWLGENLNYSPYKINYLLNQYSGGVGDVLLPMLTPEAESGDNSLLGNMIAPLKDQFTTDSVMNNQNVSDFYDTKDLLTANAKSSKATDEDVLKSKFFNSINSELSDLYKKKREIQSSDLPDAEKYSAVREIQKEINALTKYSLEEYQGVSISDGYATVGDLRYRLNNKGEWTKITTKQYAKQEKVTSFLDISGSDYWKNKSEYDFAYEYPEKYKVAKAVGGFDAYKKYTSELYDIKADKDSSGKTISGSRKEKVIEYINNLNIEYGEAIILFKSEYNADDTYNKDIIDYLNSRDDISYKEMETILKELGFTVKSDGTVLW